MDNLVYERCCSYCKCGNTHLKVVVVFIGSFELNCPAWYRFIDCVQSVANNSVVQMPITAILSVQLFPSDLLSLIFQSPVARAPLPHVLWCRMAEWQNDRLSQWFNNEWAHENRMSQLLHWCFVFMCPRVNKDPWKPCSCSTLRFSIANKL